MALSLCFTSSLTSPFNPPGNSSGNLSAPKLITVKQGFSKSGTSKFVSFEVKATGSNPSTKSKSIVCSDCDGNGSVQCSQCKGTGVNSKDHFNGQFKAGGLCWLCRGKKEILCGNCNGAGFLGGILSTFED